MRNSLCSILKGLLAASAVTTLIACEEVDPPKKIDKPMVAQVEPVKVAPIGLPVETPKPVAQEVLPPKSDGAPIEESDDDRLVGDKLLAEARRAIDGGQLQRGLALAQRGVKKMPSRSAAWNTLGRAQLKSGSRRAAIASFENAVECNPRSSYAQNNLGLALIYDGRFDEAVDALEEATEGKPVEGYMFNNLGMAYEHLDRLDEARDAYRQAALLKAPRAGENLARLSGVKSIRTAKADGVKSDVHVVDHDDDDDHVGGGVDLSTVDGDGGMR